MEITLRISKGCCSGRLACFVSCLLLVFSDLTTAAVEEESSAAPLITLTDCASHDAQRSVLSVAPCKESPDVPSGDPGDQRTAAYGSSADDCWVNYNDIALNRDRSNIILADIRSPEAYESYRIPGSLNIPLFALRTKNYLKTRHVVLVDGGDSQQLHGAVCIRLMRQGFKNVQVLEGGMPSWVLNGGDIIGHAPTTSDLIAITPRQFYADQTNQHWIVALDSRARDEDKDLFSGHSLVYLGNSPEASVRKIREVAGKKPIPVLVVNPSINNAYLFRIAQGLGDGQVRYLRGGIEEYRKYLEVRSAILSPLSQPLSTRKRCSG